MVLDEEPSRTVLIGSSRILFDFDMDVYEKAIGRTSAATGHCRHQSRSLIWRIWPTIREFSGTVIVGVVPGLFMAPGGPPVDAPKKHLDRYRNWSPTQTGRTLHRQSAGTPPGIFK